MAHRSLRRSFVAVDAPSPFDSRRRGDRLIQPVTSNCLGKRHGNNRPRRTFASQSPELRAKLDRYAQHTGRSLSDLAAAAERKRSQARFSGKSRVNRPWPFFTVNRAWPLFAFSTLHMPFAHRIDKRPMRRAVSVTVASLAGFAVALADRKSTRLNS